MPQMFPHSRDYRLLSLMDLVVQVIQDEDQTALEEILSRPLFYSTEKSLLNLPEFLRSLQTYTTQQPLRRRIGNAYETADKAYELALDKFSNLPKRTIADNIHGPDYDAKLKRKGSNCCLYYRGFLRHIRRKLKSSPPKGSLDEELILAKELQKFVKYHFYKALLEAERCSNPFWSRYFWEINGRKICLWMPKYIYGHQRRRWLEKNIPDPDPSKPNERERIQDIINRKIAYHAFVPLDENIPDLKDKRFKPEEINIEPFCQALPDAVAEEKTANIKQQRRAIQKLGKPKLKKLILKVFDSLDSDNTLDLELAREFGLSKATFSRFAGSHWNKSEGNTIPDLWQNTAQVLAMNPDFKDIVLAAGIWKEVRAMVAEPNKK